MSNVQPLPEAFYDSLSLAHKLDDFFDRFHENDIHLFAYFSLLLFLYKKKSISEWKYNFIVSQTHYPFSTELNDSIQLHIRNNSFETIGDFYKLSSKGVDDFNRFKDMELFRKREDFLRAACNASIVVPYSITQKAIINEPGLNHAREMQRDMDDKRWIYDGDDQNRAYQDFAEISKKIGINVADLIIPAVTWIDYLYEQAKEEMDAEF